MNQRSQNQTLNEFINHLCSDQNGPELGKVAIKFVRNMIRGISRTRSVNLTYIAKELDEGIRLHATHKRLSRNLHNPALAEGLTQRLLRLGAASVDDNTHLIVFMDELNKKYARKVEYLSEQKPDSESGFKMCEIMAYDPHSGQFTPLLISVWSHRVPGFTSDTDEVEKAIARVLDATDNKGMVYFDGVVSYHCELLQLVKALPQMNFIALIQQADDDVIYRNEVCKLRSLVEAVETPYGKTVFKLIPEGAAGTSRNTDMDLFMHVGAMAIKLPDYGRNLRLIGLKSKTD